MSTPFNGPLYIERQTQAILNRLTDSNGPLYLEIGGHFLVDNHASRVLPGYIPDSKAQIFRKLADYADLSIIFCINAKDVIRDRQFGQKYCSFEKHLLNELTSIEKVLLSPIQENKKTTPFTPPLAKGAGGINTIKELERISIVITMLDHDFIPPQIRDIESSLHSKGYATYRKYLIDGYPQNTNLILSKEGYGKDDYIPFGGSASSPLIKGELGGICLVSACGSNSGKLNTCLSQLYLDHQAGIQSNYAKFETFPIRNLPIDHPINLAYEAATADIGDYNMIDPYYLPSGKALTRTKREEGSEEIITQSTNYNRDVQAFEIIKSFSEKTGISPLGKERGWGGGSPTAMGINTAGFCLSDDEISKKAISDACRKEIQSRLTIYTKLLHSGHCDEEAVEKCKELLKKFAKV